MQNYFKEIKQSSTLGNVWLDCWIKTEKGNLSSCTYKYKANFYANSLVNDCLQYCPLECDTETSYSATINSINLYDNLTTVQIYFRSLQYTSISQKPRMQTFDLISNVGGTFGLFVGVSFVSLFEATEIFLEISFVLFGRLIVIYKRIRKKHIISPLEQELFNKIHAINYKIIQRNKFFK